MACSPGTSPQPRRAARRVKGQSSLDGYQDWIKAVGAKTANIAPGNSWENGYVESFNARLRDELLDGEIFYSLMEAQVVIEKWRRYFNPGRPHGSIGYKLPAPEVFLPTFTLRPATQPRPAPPTMLMVAPRPTMN